MIRYSFLFFIIFLIRLLSAFSWGNTTSVVPGWHTTIYPPWFFVSVFHVIWLGIAAAIYFLVEKKGKTVLKKIFLLHVFLSLFVFWDYGYTIPGNYFTEAVFIAAPTILFFLGQVVFIIGVFKAKVPIVASTASNN